MRRVQWKIWGCFFLCGIGVAVGDVLTWNGADGEPWDLSQKNWLSETQEAVAWKNGSSAVFAKGGRIELAGEGIEAGSLLIRHAEQPLALEGGPLTLVGEARIETQGKSSLILNLPLRGTAGAAFLPGTASLSFDEYLTASEQVVLKGIRLADIQSFHLKVNGGAINASAKGTEAVPYFDTTHPDQTRTIQFQVSDNQLKCVKVQFRESNGDVLAKALYAKWLPRGTPLGTDFDQKGNVTTLVSRPTDAGYGLYGLAVDLRDGAGFGSITLNQEATFTGPLSIGKGKLLIRENGRFGRSVYAGTVMNRGTVSFRSNRAQIFSGPIHGEGEWEVIGPASTAPAVTNLFEGFLQTNAYVQVARNLRLGDVCTLSGEADGQFVSPQFRGKPYQPFLIQNDGATLRALMEIVDDGYIKCVEVELRQEGEDIVGKALKACNKKGTAGNYEFVFSWEYNEMSVAQTPKEPGYGIKNLKLIQRPYLSFAPSAAWNGQVNVSQGGLLRCPARNSLPKKGGTVLSEGAKMIFSVPYSHETEDYGTVGSCPIEILSDSLLVVEGGFNLLKLNENRSVHVDRSEIRLNRDSGGRDSLIYINGVNLSNGGRITGGDGRICQGTIQTTGTEPSRIETGIIFFKLPGMSSRFSFDVEDVTQDPSTDLTILKGIRDISDPKGKGATFIKKGQGTLTLGGRGAYIGESWLEDGVLQCGCENALPPHSTLRLKGGTLSLGVYTTHAGMLAVDQPGVIDLEEGNISFADSSSLAWTAGLTIRGVLGKDRVRFGTDDHGLTAEQLALISLEETRGHVIITPEGYLKLGPKGSVLLLQ